MARPSLRLHSWYEWEWGGRGGGQGSGTTKHGEVGGTARLICPLSMHVATQFSQEAGM